MCGSFVVVSSVLILSSSLANSILNFPAGWMVWDCSCLHLLKWMLLGLSQSVHSISLATGHEWFKWVNDPLGASDTWNNVFCELLRKILSFYSWLSSSDNLLTSTKGGLFLGRTSAVEGKEDRAKRRFLLTSLIYWIYPVLKSNLPLGI